MAALKNRSTKKTSAELAEPLMHSNLNIYDSLDRPNEEQVADDLKCQVVMSLTDQQLEFKEHNEEQEHATQPFFNNQNTILMAARSCNGDIMLMHETRIFYFSPSPDVQIHATITTSDFAYAQAVDHMISLLLGMLTTRKYRLLTSFYLLWRILDYGMLAALILTLFFDKKYDTFSNIIWKNIWIFVVVALEIFYDVLEFIVKIWLLNRVSIYIGFVLYALYYAAFQHHQVWSTLVYALFALRFISFIGEELIDVCIDLELEYDLTEATIHKLEVPLCIKTKHEERIALLHVSPLNNTIDLATGWEFKGSIIVWTWSNTFRCLIQRKEDIDKTCVHSLYRFVFHFMFGVTYCIIGIPLLIIILGAVIFLSILKLCSRCCGGTKDTILDECFHRYSY